MAAIGVAAAMLIGAAAGTASADPKSEDIITLTCPGMEPVQIVGNGNGQFTPGLDIASTDVYQPIGFADEHYEVRNEFGEVIEEGSSPGQYIKKGKRNGQTIVECTYLATFAGEDPDLGYIEGEFGGTVYVVMRSHG